MPGRQIHLLAILRDVTLLSMSRFVAIGVSPVRQLSSCQVKTRACRPCMLLRAAACLHAGE